ncbi:hypothetical protein FOA52_011091 [Chlamydomonas sp. UWO 241]|nr:hypothetical protein FOA52_011091 [Chlamydomonas sp. UWO 241]
MGVAWSGLARSVCHRKGVASQQAGVKRNQVAPEPVDGTEKKQSKYPRMDAFGSDSPTAATGTDPCIVNPQSPVPPPKGAKWGKYVAELQQLAARAASRADLPAKLAASMQGVLHAAPAWLDATAKLPHAERMGACAAAAAAAAGLAEAVLHPVVAHAERTLAHGSASSSSGGHGHGGGSIWDALEVDALLAALSDGARSAYSTDLKSAAAPAAAAAELLLSLRRAGGLPGGSGGTGVDAGCVPSLSSVAGSLGIVFFRQVTLESGEALASKARQLGDVVFALGLLSCDALGACLEPGARAMLAGLQHAAQCGGERRLTLQVSRDAAFPDALEQASDAGVVPRDAAAPPHAWACYKVFPAFVDQYDGGGAMEAGEGHGPRKEFFALAAAGMCSSGELPGDQQQQQQQQGSKQELFVFNRAAGCFWYNSHLGTSDDARAAYRFAGWLIASSLLNKAPLGIKLAAPLCEQLLIGVDAFAPTLKMLSAYDPDAAGGVARAAALPRAQLDAMLDMEGLPAGSSPQQYAASAVRSLLLGDAEWAARSLVAGFQASIDVRMLRAWCVDAEALSSVLEGGGAGSTGPIDVRSVFRVVADDELDADAGSVLGGLLWKVLSSWPRTRHLQFLHFVTGSDRLPLPGCELLKLEAPFIAFGAAQHKAQLGMLPQAHTCDNLLELPDYWASLLHTRGFAGNADAVPPDQLDELKRECERILDDRLTLAVTCASGYGLDQRDARRMMKSSLAVLLVLALASSVCVDARFGRGLLEARGRVLQSAPAYPPSQATATAVAIAEAVASGDTTAAASAIAQASASGDGNAIASALSIAIASASASGNNQALAQSLAQAVAQGADATAIAEALAVADTSGGGGDSGASAQSLADALSSGNADAVANSLAESSGGSSTAVAKASSQALSEAADATASAVSTAIAEVCGGGDVTAAAEAVATATATATAKAFASASADVEVKGTGKACADATAAATATAKAVATAIASAFASATNDCAEAIAAAEAQAFQEKIATAIATASADACSTGGKASASADAVATAVATATATAYAAALAEVQGACGCSDAPSTASGSSPESPSSSPDVSPSSPGASPSGSSPSPGGGTATATAVAIAEAVASGDTSAAASAIAQASASGDGNVIASALSIAIARASASGNNQALAQSMAQAVAQGADATAIAEALAVADTSGGGDSGASAQSLADALSSGNADAVASSLAESSGGASTAVAKASSQALSEAADATASAVAVAIAEVCGGGDATAAAEAVATATATATAKAFASASADVEVTGTGKACASATAAATATAKAVATAIASAFASATNDCAEAIAAAEAQAFQEKIATATATASADACSTEVQGACGCSGGGGTSPSSPDVSPSSPGASPISPTPSPDVAPPATDARKCEFWVQRECCEGWTPEKTSCNYLGPLGYRYTLVATNPPTFRDKFFRNDCVC